MLDKILFFGASPLNAAPTPFLASISIYRLSFYIAGMGYRNHDIFLGYQIFPGKILSLIDNFSTSFIAKPPFHLQQILPDNAIDLIFCLLYTSDAADE